MATYGMTSQIHNAHPSLNCWYQHRSYTGVITVFCECVPKDFLSFAAVMRGPPKVFGKGNKILWATEDALQRRFVPVVLPVT